MSTSVFEAINGEVSVCPSDGEGIHLHIELTDAPEDQAPATVYLDLETAKALKEELSRLIKWEITALPPLEER